MECKPTDVCSGGVVTLSCPLGQVASSQACVCAAGYFESNTTCEACPVGSYKASAGAHACTPCEGIFTTKRTRAMSGEMCVCPSGWSLNASLDGCDMCPKGTYKEYAGSRPCTPCAKGFTTGTGGTELAAACVARKGVFSATKKRHILGGGAHSRQWRVKSGKAYYLEGGGLKLSSAQDTRVEFDVFVDIFV